jgi:hypothetical protein
MFKKEWVPNQVENDSPPFVIAAKAGNQVLLEKELDPVSPIVDSPASTG